MRYTEEDDKRGKNIGYYEGVANSIWIKGVIHIRIDRKKALNLFEEGYELAEQIDYKIGMCRTQIGITSLYTDFGKIAQSDSILKRLLPIAENIKDDRILADIHYSLSRNGEREGRYLEAIDLLNKVIEFSIKNNDLLKLSQSYGGIAINYQRQGKLKEALEYNIKARQIFEQIGHKRGEISTLTNIGGILYAQKEYEAAIEILIQSYEIAKTQNNSSQTCAILLNISNIYQKQNNPEALACLKRAWSIVDGEDKSIQIAILQSLCTYHISQNSFDEANDYLNQAFALADTFSNKSKLPELWMVKGVYHNKRNQHASAIEYAQKALEEATKRNLNSIVQESMLTMVDSYSKMGNYKNALELYIRHKALNDSIFNESNIRKLTLLESSYEYDKQKREYELEHAKHEMKIKNQRHIIGGVTAIAVLIFVMLVMMYRSSKLKKRILRLQIKNINREIEMQQQEMAAAKLKVVQKAERETRCIKLLESMEEKEEDSLKENRRSLISDYKNQSDKSSWQEFETLFTKITPQFYDQLHQRFPTLTPNERKLCVFLKLNMSNKEIGNITFQSEEALKKARLRLRKKLNIERETNLNTFFQDL